MRINLYTSRQMALEETHLIDERVKFQNSKNSTAYKIENPAFEAELNVRKKGKQFNESNSNYINNTLFEFLLSFKIYNE